MAFFVSGDMTTFRIVEGESGFEPFGGARELWQCKAPEVMLSGPAETGKTRACLEKLDALAWKYPNMQAAIVRKVFADLKGSVLQTYERKVIGAWNGDTNSFDPTLTPIKKYGGERVQFYDYPNGSRIWVGGLDNPSKVLSAERDVVYVNQTEELRANDWETLTTRVTGRAGNMPYAQLIGDCNPGPANHWILRRVKSGSLKMFLSRHEDNPTLWDREAASWTAQGERTLATLDALTGVRKQRLRHGEWVSAEGQVYEGFNPAIHLVDPFEIPSHWRRFRAIDFGYVNPFVCLWCALDEDERLFVYRQLYMTGRTVNQHAVDVICHSEGEEIEATICDHESNSRATLLQAGVDNSPADKRMDVGIEKVQERLNDPGDGTPRFFIIRGSLIEEDRSLTSNHKPCKLEDEFENYVWHAQKDVPVKKDDHALDTLRYAVMYADTGGVWFS